MISMIVYDKEILKRKQYWSDQFNMEPYFVSIPNDFQSETHVEEKASLSITIDATITNELLRVCKYSDMLIYTFLLTVSKISLYRYSSSQQLGIGVPSYDPVFKVIPVISRLESSQSYKEVLMEVKDNLKKAYINQDFPIDQLYAEGESSQTNDRPPWCKWVVSLDNIHDPTCIESEAIDVALMFARENEELRVRLLYNPTLYSESSIKLYVELYLRILKSILTNPSAGISEVKMCTEAEEKQMLIDCEGTLLDYDKNLTLAQLFERQVALHPEAIAICDEDRHLTYRELNEISNQWASVLRRKGVCTNQPIAIMLERTTELIIGILAVTKAGGFYVPISTDYPVERIQYILEDSGCLLALTEKRLFHNVDFKGQWIYLDRDEAKLESIANLPLQINANDLIYMIYTSGSTGNPKGVMIEHGSVHNMVIGHKKLYKDRLDSTDRFLVCTNISFDASSFEIWVPLLLGARLVMYANEKFDVERLANTMVQKEVTIAFIPPTLLSPLYTRFEESGMYFPLKKMFVGGETVKGSILENYFKLNSNLNIINAYGPTETTVTCSGYHYESRDFVDQHVSIGKPIVNTQIYLLNTEMQLVPRGVSGDLWVGGEGVARGYWNQPNLTAERFIDNPFRPGTKMYRTGDIAKRLLDGNLQFIGRSDHQVKIRGYRIEPGEIENQLRLHEDVRSALVLVKEDIQNEKYLCAYVVLDGEVTSNDLHNWLLRKLPVYMVPSTFVMVDDFPLTLNGKVDHRALPEPNGDKSTLQEKDAYCAPRSPLEHEIVELWKEVLQIEHIGVFDNFFALGGHSLKAITLTNKLTQKMGVNIPLSALFKHPTVADLSHMINAHQEPLNENLVLLNKGKQSFPPLFIVHGQGGGIMNFVYLTKELGTEYPIYAFQATGYDDGDSPEWTVEQMAAQYIAEMREIVPKGPYNLLGWSFGGMLAYEMTKQLEADGDTVSYLAVCDVKPFPRSEEKVLRANQAYDPLIRYALLQGLDENFLDGMSEAEQIKACQQRISDQLSDEVQLNQISHSKLRVLAINGLAVNKYQFKGSIQTDVHLFLALEDSLIQMSKPEKIAEMWSELTRGRIKLSLIDGNHYSMLEPPHVTQLVQNIHSQLREKTL
ncbi:amino acid adenylation domain-containing protein [Hazenella sp. IB182357]|uniref:Amino acid adenylation domain-containing protein n=1 Tax=Polycladospora coralii TaxID=2771432 RepID=A0A926RU97_9BACL|nr:non-ribosomal peptide synthetase [Polycladospora coralii]MBD1372688.1 amino acid adenylation domain-containing protein [Polycladospora coralii]